MQQNSQAAKSSPAPTGSRRGTTQEPIINSGEDDDHQRQPSPAPSDIQGIIAGLPSTAIIRSTQQSPVAEPGTAPPASSAPSHVRSSFTAVNGSKRPRGSQSQSQEPDDDGFEEDHREPNPQRREQIDRDRRDMPPPSRPAKRIRLPSSSRAPSSTAPPSADPSRSEPPNGTPPSSSASSMRSSVASTGSIPSFSQISIMNRRAQLRSTGPQQRVPWSDKDTRRLIRLIEYHNCLWARIAKRQAPEGRIGDPGPEDSEDCVFDHPRDQQAIRDKARNLKVDMLK